MTVQELIDRFKPYAQPTKSDWAAICNLSTGYKWIYQALQSFKLFTTGYIIKETDLQTALTYAYLQHGYPTSTLSETNFKNGGKPTSEDFNKLITCLCTGTSNTDAPWSRVSLTNYAANHTVKKIRIQVNTDFTWYQQWNTTFDLTVNSGTTAGFDVNKNPILNGNFNANTIEIRCTAKQYFTNGCYANLYYLDNRTGKTFYGPNLVKLTGIYIHSYPSSSWGTYDVSYYNNQYNGPLLNESEIIDYLDANPVTQAQATKPVLDLRFDFGLL